MRCPFVSFEKCVTDYQELFQEILFLENDIYLKFTATENDYRNVIAHLALSKSYAMFGSNAIFMADKLESLR